MANRKPGKRGSGIIALIAVIAAIAGPSTAAATPGKNKGAPNSNAPANTNAPAVVPAYDLAPGLSIADASWAE
jgi:hypothetical protein